MTRTLSEPTPAEVKALLLAAGYKQGNVADFETHQALYYKRSGVDVETSDGEIRRGQIDIKFHALEIHGEIWASYTVGSTFPTPLGWFQSQFYSLRPPEVLARLPQLETELVALQARLMGDEA